MKGENKVKNPSFFGILVLVLLLGFGFEYFNNIEFDSQSCIFSPYNHYSNATEGMRKGDNCYIPVNKYYYDNERCGFLGISCYESSEMQRKNYRIEVCFNINTGERC